jgi:2-keto-3-deoxy-L-rhamnonate aldolase RhmA
MASMKATNRLRVALGEATPAFGCWQMIPGSNVSRTLARTGVDWVLIDQEHGNIDGQCVSRNPVNNCASIGRLTQTSDFEETKARAWDLG